MDDIPDSPPQPHDKENKNRPKTEIYGPIKPESFETDKIVSPISKLETEEELKPKTKPGVFIKRGVKGFLLLSALLFLALHLYLVALRFLPAPLTLNMVLNSDPLQRNIVSLKEISPNLITAVIAAEDTRFCQHKGIDFEALEKAIEENQKRSRPRGASTLSQQTAKNIMFWNGGGYARKAGEAYVTVIIELIWPKNKIMEHYLNVADWGNGIYGAEAAAQVRFKKSAGSLTAREAALLASVLPNPHKWRVDPPGEYVSQRVGTVQARMAVVKSDQLDSCAQP